MFIFRLIIIIICLSLLAVSLIAQPAPIPFRTVSYFMSSGSYNGQGESIESVWQCTIKINNAPWLRLRFGQVFLGNSSYLRITSLLDSSTQHLNAISMLQWYNTSAFFNGDAVEIRLFVAPHDVGVYVEINEVIVGEYQQHENGLESICGTSDDRTRSTNNAVGRIITVGCTGWIVSNGLHVTAGHCVDNRPADVLQFNVPSSLPDGTIQHPPARDQYSIDRSSITYQNGGVGNDWAVFRVFNNSETGLQPIDAYGASFCLAQDLTPSQLRVTGYGVDGPPPNFGNPPPRNSDSQTQQTHIGSNAGSSGTVMHHTADTQPGNSGSPIIDENTGHAVGVHSHGGCTSTGGSNKGTSTYHLGFWNALNPTAIVTLDQKRQDGTRLTGTTIGRWNGTSFSEITITTPPPTIHTAIGSREVLRGYQQLVTNPTEKYRVWERNQFAQLDTIQNHRGFTIRSDDQNFTSRFHPSYSGITIRNELIDVPTLTGGSIEFKDPWLVDVTDSRFYEHPYGYRNLGMSAPFKSESSPFTPTLASKYKGVFLNQGLTPQGQWQPPYYSVRAISPQAVTINGRTHNFYFQNWSANPPGSAEFQNPNALETPVIFKEANATVQANMKGTQLSNDINAFINNQRKFAYSYYHPLYNVYQSFGKIWLEYSFNNGSTWNLGNFGKPISSNEAKSPSIAVFPAGPTIVTF